MEKDRVIAKVANNKEAVEIILNRREKYYKSQTEEGLGKWKEHFESEYADDMDRALIA
jgi:hypothetical protein